MPTSGMVVVHERNSSGHQAHQVVSPITSPKTALLSSSYINLQTSDDYVKVTNITQFEEPKIQT